jgi:hypothetical protein
LFFSFFVYYFCSLLFVLEGDGKKKIVWLRDNYRIKLQFAHFSWLNNCAWLGGTTIANMVRIFANNFNFRQRIARDFHFCHFRAFFYCNIRGPLVWGKEGEMEKGMRQQPSAIDFPARIPFKFFPGD